MSSLTEAFYRRLYSFHKPSGSEEFYSKDQPRGKDGRWASMGGRTGKTSKVAQPTTDKMWTGVSAHPDKRKAPKSDLTFPVERGDYEDTQGQANRRFARDIYDTDLGGGYRSSVSQVTVYDNKDMSIQGVITYKGKEVGTFDRGISVEGRGVVAVDHTELMIHAQHRSKGLADRFNAHAVAKYQEMGVDRITLHAGDEVGGFAWARQGFRFANYDTRVKTVHNALKAIEADAKYSPLIRDNPEAKKQIEDEVFAIRKAMEAGEDVQPIHLASIGERTKWQSEDEIGNPYTNWPGKRAMMRQSWEGVYYFDANAAVTAAASSLEHAALRPQFRASKPRKPTNHELVELAFNPKQPRDKEGKWSTLYRGEGSHDRPSYYPKTGPDAALSGAWWTDDQAKAKNYAAGGTVYKIKVKEGEYEPRGAAGNYVILDPAVRARRTEVP